MNLVSKRLQSKDMLIDVAIKEVKGIISFFKDYRGTEYSKSIEEAKKIAIEMDINPVFTQKRVIRRKNNLMRIQIVKMLCFPQRSHSR